MHRRKIQLIAGTTYSVSLPKAWVLKNKLRAGDDIIIDEKGDNKLILHIKEFEKSAPSEMTLDIAEYGELATQAIFTLYYLGIEDITIKSSKEILSKEQRTRIRKTLSQLSGAEITYEDSHIIKVKLLIDSTKLDAIQTIYRMILIVENSISTLIDGPELEDLRVNEEEIDRLYNLMVKMISSSLLEPNVLQASNIKHVSLIPSFFMISKKLENLGDHAYYLGEYLINKKQTCFHKPLQELNSELHRCGAFVLKIDKGLFSKMELKKKKRIKEAISKTEDRAIFDFLYDMLRYLNDIQEELISISFYKQLIKMGKL